jgi:predicted Rossmann-fold nucleotide-binding protein
MKKINMMYKYVIALLIVTIITVVIYGIKGYYTKNKKLVVVFGSVSRNIEKDKELQEQLSLLASRLNNKHDYLVPNSNSGIIGYFLEKLHSNTISKNIQTNYVTTLPPEKVNKYYNVKYFDTLLDYENDMLEKSDIVIFLPGGIGTMYELAYIQFVVLEGIQNKKVILFNINGAFDYMIDKIESFHREGYLRENVYETYKDNFLITTDAEEIITFLENEV